MKYNDQTLLQEAYEKVLFDKGKQSIEELTKEIDKLKEKLKNARDENDKKQLNKILKAKMEKRAELVGNK
jgi:signal transduction histidine kinase